MERILWREGVRDLHSNDVSLYSCALGSYLAGIDCPVTLKPETGYAWMAPYLTPGPSLIAHLLLAMEYVKYTGRREPYHRRMAAAYEHDWPTLHAKTVDRVKTALGDLRLASFFPGDVVDHMRAAPDDAVAIAFAPTYESGYEKLYAKFASIFDWTAPTYVEFTAERFTELTAVMQEKQTWVTLRDVQIPELAAHCIGSFQTSARSKTVYVYAGAGRCRVSIPVQKVEPVPLSRLEGVGAGDLKLVRLTAGQMNLLRSEYLAATIVPAGAQINIGVVWGDKLVGACGFSPPQMLGGWCDVYQMTDFSVRPAIYKHLSKLVLAAIISTEMQAVLEQGLNRRVATIGTTAFTDKPVSMKYRGVYDLLSRKDGKLNYMARTGRWSLAAGLAWWQKQHGDIRGGRIDGDPALPSAQPGSSPGLRSAETP